MEKEKCEICGATAYTLPHKHWETRFEQKFPFWKTGQECLREPTDETKPDIKDFIRSVRADLIDEMIKILEENSRQIHGGGNGRRIFLQTIEALNNMKKKV